MWGAMSVARGVCIAAPQAAASRRRGEQAGCAASPSPHASAAPPPRGAVSVRASARDVGVQRLRGARRCRRGRETLVSRIAFASSAELASTPSGGGEELRVPEQKGGKFRDIGKRLSVALVVGAICGIAVFQGGVVFSLLISALSYQSSVEYFGLINATSKAEHRVLHPPKWGVSIATVLCGTIPLLTYWFAGGRLKAALTVMAFGLLVLMLVMQRRPRFSQFTSTVFGLFYCGYLPSFWLKLRMLNTPIGAGTVGHQFLSSVGLSSLANVGLLATLISVLCIIAADTGAYVVGKSMGKTQLIAISPKKTVEGATGGMLCAFLTAIAGSFLFGWPGSYLSAAVFSVLVFLASLFGDLMESVMKRDAGVKDSGELLPGHGGLLDRFDSYMFTGAMVYFYVKLACPWLGWA